jgi:hypothetical protein
MTVPTATTLRAELSENTTDPSDKPSGFMPSSVSAREQRAREQTDRTIDAFLEKFTEKGFFPQDSEAMVFSLLPQLSEWPANLQLKIVDENGDELATYLKGNDPRIILSSVSVVEDRYGEYVTSEADNEETLFKVIFDQLPPGSGLGLGGDFPGSSTTAGRIVTLREQLVELLRSERAKVFEALLADDDLMKSESGFSVRNRFLPLWKRHTTEYSPVLNILRALNPEVPAERLAVLLERFPLSEVQARDLLEKDIFPEPFLNALNRYIDEWQMDRGLDGVFHTRTYNPDTDELTRHFGRRILRDVLGLELFISEVDDKGQYIVDPQFSTGSILLLHKGEGNYAVKNFKDDEVSNFNIGTDSFYRAIASVLQPAEYIKLGMLSDHDVGGFRLRLGNVAATANGGWFSPQTPLQINPSLLPAWLKDASVADKLVWSTALLTYRQALIEAQAPALLTINQYLNPGQLRAYARNLLRNRLDFDLGLRLDPDAIIVVTTTTRFVPTQGGAVGLYPGGAVPPLTGGGLEIISTRRSLTELCLNNLSAFDLDFVLTAKFLDKDDRPVMALSPLYVHGLVRELNVGESYTAFLKKRLLASSLGQWNRDKYAQAMDAQMRLDVIEAKMAGDLTNDGGLPPERANRSYKWVQAVLNQALDSGATAMVEGHRIRVQTLRLKDMSSHDPLDFITGNPLAQLNGVTLRGLLMIAPEASKSVPSVVVYTPSAPDSVCFREYASEAEMRSRLFHDPVLGGYLKSRLPVDMRSILHDELNNGRHQSYLKIEAHPLASDNFYFASYEAEVQRVISEVDDLTTSTAEANGQTAWNTVSALANLAIEFAPFKVRLPIAAARSMFAVSQGVRAAGEGDTTAAVHFLQAALLLTDGLPGGEKPKAKLPSSGGLRPATALETTPEGLTMRTDGVYSGVYEKPQVNGFSAFFAKSGDKTFPVRYDAPNGTWRAIDPRRPDALYQMPIRIDGQGQWNYDPVGLLGGGPGKGAKKAAKAAKAANANPTSGPTKTVNAPPAAPGKRIDMEGFFESKGFTDAEDSFPHDNVRAQVEKAVALYTDRRKGRLHPSEGGYTIDLPHLGSSSGGRGKWRLRMLPFYDPDTGILVENAVRPLDIINPHKG